MPGVRLRTSDVTETWSIPQTWPVSVNVPWAFGKNVARFSWTERRADVRSVDSVVHVFCVLTDGLCARPSITGRGH